VRDPSPFMTTCERDVRLNVGQLRLSDLVQKKKKEREIRTRGKIWKRESVLGCKAKRVDANRIPGIGNCCIVT
jgi:hypothetical protein